MLAALGQLTVAEELVILPTVGMSDDSKYGRAGEHGQVMQQYMSLYQHRFTEAIRVCVNKKYA